MFAGNETSKMKINSKLKVHWYTFKGDNSFETFLLLSEIAPTLKGNNLLSLGANSFLLE